MNNEIKIIKINEDELLDNAIEYFSEWFSSGLRRPKNFTATRDKIRSTIHYSEFIELSFYPILKSEGYNVLASNIHFRPGNGRAVYTDMIAKKGNVIFFTEVKGTEKHRIDRIKANFKAAFDDIEIRVASPNEHLEIFEIPWYKMPLKKPVEYGGIACVASEYKLSIFEPNYINNYTSETYSFVSLYLEIKSGKNANENFILKASV